MTAGPDTEGGTTVPVVLRTGEGSRPALRAPGRPPLDFDGLRALAARTVEALNARVTEAGVPAVGTG